MPSRPQADRTARPYRRSLAQDENQKKKNRAKVLAGRKGGKTRTARQRLVLEQGPTEILTALNAFVRMNLAHEDPGRLASVRALHRALGTQGALFVGEHMPTPSGDALAHLGAIMVLAPMVTALSELTDLIGPGGLVKDVHRRVATLQAAWHQQEHELEHRMWNTVNPDIGRSLLSPPRTPEEHAKAERRYQAYLGSPSGAPLTLLRRNLGAASALLSRVVGAPAPWRRALYRCERFPQACRGAPFCLRRSTNPQTRRCPKCGRQGRRITPCD